MNALALPDRWLTNPIRIDIAGAGGTGSQVVDQIASLDSLMRALGHPGFTVRLFDHDTVSRFNIGRQRFTHMDLGLNKAAVLIHRINLFYGVNYTPVPDAYRPVDAYHCDMLVTCTDSARFRAAVGKHWAKRETRTLWLDFGNGNAGGQVVLGHLGKSDAAVRVPNVFDLFPQLSNMDDADSGPSCSMEEAVRKQPWPANRSVAIAGVSLVERLLRTGAVDWHGSLVQLDPYTVQPLMVDPISWAMYGYTPPAKKRHRAVRGKAA